MLPRIILQIARLSALILTSIIFCHIFYISKCDQTLDYESFTIVWMAFYKVASFEIYSVSHAGLN